MIEFFNENAEFLLGRPAYSVIDSKTECFFKNKCILVTGGGGTIGSELCRTAARCGADKIVILDINENNAHDVYESLAYAFPTVDAKIVIASVRDRERMCEIFSKYSPDVVFHAAAHKHVSLMEKDPSEAVKNNIFGTLNVVDASEDCGVSSFVLISTDKAVEPTSVMGATKRFCEYIISSRQNSKTVFSAVRFGNVLGSSGSVLPDFCRAIKRGGVVKITDKDAKRYFMTAEEAAELVLSAAAKETGGIYVLDMGDPVRIATLALRLGELLSRDVRLEFTSLGEGEKLAEKLYYGEPARCQDSPMFREDECKYTREEIMSMLKTVSESLEDDSSVKCALRDVVKEYR